MEIQTADLFTQEPPSPRTFGSWPSSSRAYMCIPVDRFVQCEWLRELGGPLPSPAPQAFLLESTPTEHSLGSRYRQGRPSSHRGEFPSAPAVSTWACLHSKLRIALGADSRSYNSSVSESPQPCRPYEAPQRAGGSERTSGHSSSCP